MPKIKFLEDFEYKPVPQQTYVYKKDDVALVTQDIANKAISSNKAESTESIVPSSGINETIGKFKNTRKRVNKSSKKENVKSEEEIPEEKIGELPI